MSSNPTVQKWYQGKRVPLYVIVGTSLAGAAVYLTTNRSTHPLVETNKSIRKDGLPTEDPSSPDKGKDQFESSGRKLTRDMGLHGATQDEPQRSEGIMSARKMSKKIEGTPLDTGSSKISKPQM